MIKHKHFIIRAEVKKPIIDPEVAKKWLIDLVSNIGMLITPSGGPHVDYISKPGNLGVASIVMIETSHCAMHIWDHFDPPLIQMDVYSCKDYDHQIILDMLQDMEPTKIDWILVDRSNMTFVESSK